jgi:hypothetical protein
MEAVMTIHRILPVLALTLALGACAVGNQYDYTNASPALITETSNSVSATVIDRRPYVLSGRKSANFVGLQRGGFGNPFDVTTQSGRALAADLTDALVRALKARGITASALPLGAGTSTDTAVSQFQTQDADRLLVVSMQEWKTDAMMRLTLHWALEATVHDRSGAAIASHSISGNAPVGDVAFDLEKGKSAIATQQIAAKLGELLNDPEIVAALR